MCSNDTLKSCVACPRRCPEQEVTNYINNPRIRSKFREYIHIENIFFMKQYNTIVHKLRDRSGNEQCYIVNHNAILFNSTSIIPLTKDEAKIFCIKLVRDKSLPDTICCNCVMRINCCLEFQRCIVRNMLNNRIKYYYKIGDRQNVLKYQNECKIYQAKCMDTPSGVSESFFNDSSLNRLLRIQPILADADSIVNTNTNGLIISDVRTEELIQEPDSTGDEIESEMETELNERELLEPMFQTSENALDTESGGNIHAQNEAISARRKHNDGTQLQCEYCNKVYRKANAWRKHIRTHLVEQRKLTTSGGTIMASGINAIVASNGINGEPAGNGGKRKYKCTECNLEFDTMNVLKRHGIAHEERYNCDLCDESFRLKHDYTWHRICCVAKNSISDTAMHSLKRRTRSQGRPVTHGLSNRKDPTDSRSVSSRYSVNSTQTDSLYNEKIEVVKSWRRQLNNGDRPDPNNFQDYDCLSVMSDVSGMTRLSEVTSSTISTLVVGSDAASSTGPITPEQKRRKVHKAGKRRAKQTGEAYYACSFRHECTFGSTSLKRTMAHEVKEHKSLLLHNCVECNLWFTTKENLIRHKKSHRPQLHVCINCNSQFDNKYELEHHTLSHAEKSYHCQSCVMSFLRPAELVEHTHTKHKTSTKRKKNVFERRGDDNTHSTKSHQFNGYKAKELIQPRISRSSTRNINNALMSTTRAQTLANSTAAKINQVSWKSVKTFEESQQNMKSASDSAMAQTKIKQSAASSAITANIVSKFTPKRLRLKDPKLLTLPIVVVEKYNPEYQ